VIELHAMMTHLTLGTVGTGPVAPWWLAVPMAMLAMFVIASHILMLPQAEMPDSRRRIRTANGMLMLFTAPLLAYALGFANPAADQRAFVLSWMLVTGLLIIILLVAMLDIANNYRLMFLQRKALREELRRERMEALEQAR
jgi:hypothetical protein